MSTFLLLLAEQGDGPRESFWIGRGRFDSPGSYRTSFRLDVHAQSTIS
jgi:hypothetical protein